MGLTPDQEKKATDAGVPKKFRRYWLMGYQLGWEKVIKSIREEEKGREEGKIENI